MKLFKTILFVLIITLTLITFFNITKHFVTPSIKPELKKVQVEEMGFSLEGNRLLKLRVFSKNCEKIVVIDKNYHFINLVNYYLFNFETSDDDMVVDEFKHLVFCKDRFLPFISQDYVEIDVRELCKKYTRDNCEKNTDFEVEY